LTETR